MAGDPALRRIKIPQDLWDEFGETVKRSDPELDRTKAIRQFVRWFNGEAVELPRRPERSARGTRTPTQT